MSFEKDTESSEIIYSRLKREIEKTSKEIETSINKIFGKEEVTKAKKLIDFFNQNSKWVHSTFKTEISNNKVEYPILTNPEWIEENNQKINSELGDKIYLCKDEINYTICNNEIRAIVNLKNESSFWIFLRTKGYFSKDNVIILFNREDYSQYVYITLGTFFLNLNGKLLFRPIIKQQLVFSKKKKNKNYNFENDKINLNIKIYDEGYENIIIETFLNNKKENNLIKGNFFQQIKDNYSLMFGGKGEEIKLNKLLCEASYKSYYLPIEISNNHVKGCTCCNIF